MQLLYYQLTTGFSGSLKKTPALVPSTFYNSTASCVLYSNVRSVSLEELVSVRPDREREMDHSRLQESSLKRRQQFLWRPPVFVFVLCSVRSMNRSGFGVARLIIFHHLIITQL